MNKEIKKLIGEINHEIEFANARLERIETSICPVGQEKSYQEGYSKGLLEMAGMYYTLLAIASVEQLDVNQLYRALKAQ